MNHEAVSISVVDSLEEAGIFLRWLATISEPLAIDTETGSVFETAKKPGLQWWTPHPFVRLVQFGTRDTAWVVPVHEWRQIAHDALSLVRDKGLSVIGWNFAFDMHALESDGLPTPAWHNTRDGMFLSHLLTPHARHGLKPVAMREFGSGVGVGQKMLDDDMRKSGWDWATVPTSCPSYVAYSALDVILTRRLWDLYEPRVRAEGLWEAYEREMAVRDVLFRAERRGLLVDREYTETLRDTWRIESENLRLALQAAGIRNPSSNKQVEAVLREMGWEPEELTDTGQALLDKAVKAELLEQYPEIAEPWIRYLRMTKWSSTYLTAFLNESDSFGRIHPSIGTLRARTGRMSVTGPPLQTLPSRDNSIRRCILADEGQVLYAFDYQSQEPRIFAHFCRDPEMLAALAAGKDLYTYVAQAVYDDPRITKNDPRRDMFKVMLLAFLYGAYPRKIAKIAGTSEAHAQQMIQRMLDLFPRIRDLTGDLAVGGSYMGKPALAMQQRFDAEGLGYIKTIGGRKGSSPKGEWRKATNLLMQGSAADMLKGAIVRLDMAGLSDHIAMPVHDELLMQFPVDTAKDLALTVQQVMSDTSLSIEVPASIKGCGRSWGELQDPVELGDEQAC